MGANIKGMMGTSSPLNGFVVQDVDETDSTYHYYGYENNDGISIVMRKTVATESYRFKMSGSGVNYDTFWAAKATGSYNRVSQL